MFEVVGELLFPSSSRFVDRGLHAVGDDIGVENHFGVDVSRRSANCLNQAGCASEESLLVGIENCHQRNLGEIESFTEQVDADDDVMGFFAETSQDGHTFDGIEFGMNPSCSDSLLFQVSGEVFGETLGESGDEDTFVAFGAFPDFLDEMHDLAACRNDVQRGINQSGGADDLLHDFTVGIFEFPVTGSCGDENGLPSARIEFVKSQRPIVERHRKSKTMVHQGGLTRMITSEHATDLRDGDMRFVDK